MEIRSPKTTDEWKSYYDLRYRVLRAPWKQPEGSEHDEGDQSAIHFALIEHTKVLACARLDLQEGSLAQVRFVATDPSVQGKGLGKKIMQAVEQEAIQQKISLIQLQARENAVLFYQHLGYELIEKTYLLFGEIQHYMMQKKLETKAQPEA